MYCNIFVQYVCMLNCILVYVNLCMFVYNCNVNCIVYMNSVISVSVNSLHVEHVCIEQAKLSRYSLHSIYEQPNILIIHNTINNNV